MKIINWLKKTFRFTETTESDIYGTPVSDRDLNYWNNRPLSPIWQSEIFRDKTQTIRTIQALNKARHLSRYLYETNSNAQGAINGLNRYVIGKGSDVSFQSATKEVDPPVRLTDNVTVFIDEFKWKRKWKLIEREIYRRYLIDGEVFIKLSLDSDGVTKIEFIEPDQVLPPFNENFEGKWSWGINTGDNLSDTQTPIAYNIRNLRNNTEQQVPAQFIKHLKRGSNLNQKRGIPALYPCQDEISGSQKLRYATREGEKVRASIAYVRQHAQASQATITTLQTSLSNGELTRYNQDGSQYDVSYQNIEPGSVQDIPEGMEYQPPPTSSNAEAAASAIKLSLEAVASALEVPYWMVSGDNNSSSYASSLTSESPFLKMVEGEQDVLTDYFDDILTAIIEIGIEQDILPVNTLEQIDLHINLASPVVRNLLEETQRNLLLNQAGQLSAQTWSANEGRDYDAEQANIAKETDYIDKVDGEEEKQNDTE